MPNAFDFSMLQAFTKCEKYYYFRHVRDLVLNRPQTAAEFGRCIHKALDSWYSDYDDAKATQVFMDSFTENPEDDKRNKKVAAKLLALYFDKYRDPNFKVLKSEHSFKVPLGGGISLMGRIDKVIEWDGSIVVMDHKTTSQLGSEFFNMIKPNMQFDIYIYATQQEGHPQCSQVLVDALLVAKGLCVPAQLARLTPLARDIASRSELDIIKALRNIHIITEDIQDSYERDEWIETGACNSACNYYGGCPYLRLCKEEDKIHEQIIMQDYKEEPWTPILE